MLVEELLEVRSILHVVVQSNDDTVIDGLLRTACVVDPLVLDDVRHGSAGCCKDCESLSNVVVGGNMLERDLGVGPCHQLLPVRKLIKAVCCNGCVQ